MIRSFCHAFLFLVLFHKYPVLTYTPAKHTKLMRQLGNIDVINIDCPALVLTIKLTPKIFEINELLKLNHKFITK